MNDREACTSGPIRAYMEGTAMRVEVNPDRIVRIQDGTKVATKKGVYVLEKLVMLVFRGKNYIAYLRQPGNQSSMVS